MAETLDDVDGTPYTHGDQWFDRDTNYLNVSIASTSSFAYDFDFSTVPLSLHPVQKKRTTHMLIIPVKEGESIDKALKKFKKKFERTGTMRQLRKRQSFTKPSISRRKEVIRAAYKLQMQTDEQ